MINPVYFYLKLINKITVNGVVLILITKYSESLVVQGIVRIYLKGLLD